MKKKVIIYIFLTAFLFGTMEVALKIAGSEMDSFQLTFLRFMIGGIFLIPFAVKENKKNMIRLDFKDFIWVLLLGVLCIPLSMLFFQLGIMKSNASTAAVLMSVSPLFTTIFAYIILKEKFSKPKVAGLLAGLTGICLLYTSDAADEEDSVDLGGRRIIKKKNKEHKFLYGMGM